MSDRPTPETDAFFRSFADGYATPSHAEYYDRMAQLDDAQEWKGMLSLWGSTPEIVHEFIKGQQARIHAVQDIERELEQAKQDAKQHELDCLRALGERNEAREEVKRIQHWATVNGTIEMQREITELIKQRDIAISIGLDAVGQLIDIHHVTPKRDRNIEWECRADLLDRNFRKLEDLPDAKDFSCKPPNPA